MNAPAPVRERPLTELERALIHDCLMARADHFEHLLLKYESVLPETAKGWVAAAKRCRDLAETTFGYQQVGRTQ